MGNFMRQKRIVYLTFYFRPDLCAGSFRNTPLLEELAKLAIENNAIVDVYTTLPNRYSTYNVEALEFEQLDNVNIYRIKLPLHKSGMADQIKSFWHYYLEVNRLNNGKSADLVFASSSRLFTAYLGLRLAKKFKSVLYLDVRDIFVDTISDVIGNRAIRFIILPFLKLIEKRTFNYAVHINLISEGFRDYFQKFKCDNYSNFTNGIDPEFVEISNYEGPIVTNRFKRIVYAGNLGEGQGLHKIVPQAALALKDEFEFLIIGDGGAKHKLLKAVEELQVSNVGFEPPMNRTKLIEKYKAADFLFMHLNDFDAFKKVLPSKIFELAAFDKPIIAGVGGYAAKFVRENVSNTLLFEPADHQTMVALLKEYIYKREVRTEFVDKYKRKAINEAMAESIISYL
jgi:glycosyltransferase involved in cell wall biosynthesis